MIRLRSPAGQNPHGDSPSVRRVDLTAGDVTGPAEDTRGEDPWTDLWFCSNPILVEAN